VFGVCDKIQQNITMKFAFLVFSLQTLFVTSFSVVPLARKSCISSVVVQMAPAKSAEEDMELTRKVIQEFMGDSKEEEKPSTPVAEPEPVKAEEK
jgi:hypothetical protein